LRRAAAAAAAAAAAFSDAAIIHYRREQTTTTRAPAPLPTKLLHLSRNAAAAAATVYTRSTATESRPASHAAVASNPTTPRHAAPRHTPVIARDRVNHCLRSSQSPPPDADQIDQSIIFLLTRVIAPPVSANAAVIAAVTVYCSLPPTTSPPPYTVYIINLPENTRTGYLK